VKDIKHESQRSDIRFVESPDNKSSKAIAASPKESQGDQGCSNPFFHSAPEARWEVSPACNAGTSLGIKAKPQRGDRRLPIAPPQCSKPAGRACYGCEPARVRSAQMTLKSSPTTLSRHKKQIQAGNPNVFNAPVSQKIEWKMKRNLFPHHYP
jgi:hypothetical protein